MKRKLIKQGNNSYTLTLPIKWIRDKGLDENSEIELEEKEGELIINTNINKKQIKKLELKITNYNERTIKNLLNQGYRQGYDLIKIQYKNKSQLDIIKSITRETLLGFELTEENLDSCIIENITEPSEEKFDIILRKVFLIIKNEGEEILNDILKKLDNRKKREHTKIIIDDYTNFCRRAIIKNNDNLYLQILISSRFSLIYHSYYYLYAYYLDTIHKEDVSDNLITIFKEVNNLFNLFYNAYYKGNIEDINIIEELRKEIFEKIKVQICSNTKENMLYYYLGEITRLIHMQSTNLISLILEKESQ